MAVYDTPEKLLALSQIDPELDALLKANPPPPPDYSDLAALRAARAQIEDARGPTAHEEQFESTLKIPMRDGFESEIRIHKPEHPPAKSPLIVLCFGGGFVVGSNKQLGPYARALGKLYGATTVTLNYRLAPEHPFPAAAHDTWDSVSWLAKNATSFGADPTAGFILGGVSAGGNLTAVTAQKALDEKLSPPLTGLWLSVPVLLSKETTPDKYKHLFLSREHNRNAPIFNQASIDHVEARFKPDEKSPEYSPFNVKGAHTGFPPSYFQVCGLDPLRDDGLIYEAVLREHSVKTKLDVYPGCPHAHFSFMPQLKQSRKCLADTIVGFAWLLGTQPPSLEQIQKAVAPPGGG